METSNEKRWHRAFSVQRRLDLIATARTHPEDQEFPGKLMFDTIKQLAEIADEQEARIEAMGIRIDMFEAKLGFDDFDDEVYSDT